VGECSVDVGGQARPSWKRCASAFTQRQILTTRGRTRGEGCKPIRSLHASQLSFSSRKTHSTVLSRLLLRQVHDCTVIHKMRGTSTNSNTTRATWAHRETNVFPLRPADSRHMFMVPTVSPVVISYVNGFSHSH
jgi:hypothetical protein